MALIAVVEKAVRCCGADGAKARAVGRIVRDANKTNAVVAMLVLAFFMSSISLSRVIDFYVLWLSVWLQRKVRGGEKKKAGSTRLTDEARLNHS